MKKLRIHVINRYFYPVTAGIETNLMEVYGRLAKKGHKVTIHVSRNTLIEKNILTKSEAMQGLKIKRYTFNWYGFFPDIDYSKTDIISLHNFDIFPHFHILLKIMLLRVLGKNSFKLVLTPHGGFNPEWSTFPLLQRTIKRMYHYTLGVWLVNNTVDMIRALSNWEKLEMIKHNVNPNLIKVINNGIEEEAFVDLEKLASKQVKSIVARNQPYIIQVGRIHPIKNYETTIYALTKLPSNLNYLIVGPDQDLQYKKELKKLIKKLKLDKQVKFLGVVKGVDKYYLLKHAEVMVHMAIWESYCNAVHEGMSQGLACIVSNRTALPFLVKDGVNGFCLDPDDSWAVAKKIKFVLDNKSSPIIKAIQKRNIQFAKNHSWENISEEEGNFYRKILESTK